MPPNSPVPWLELGHAFEIAHQFEQALAAYDRAATVAPRDPEGPKTGGLRAARWGEIDLAEPRLEEALRRDPRDAEAWHGLGLVRVQKGDLEGAKTAYESGLRADPAALENRVGLATVALKENHAEVALAEYDRVLVARPSFGDGYLGRAWALLLLGRLDESASSLEDARRNGADARAIARQQSLMDMLRRQNEKGP